jgi:hypothetical protein
VLLLLTCLTRASHKLSLSTLMYYLFQAQWWLHPCGWYTQKVQGCGGLSC